MNALLRMLVPLGMVVFGAVAGFMGLVVLATSVPKGEITTGIAPSAGKAASMQTVSRATDPDAYWRSVILLGALPGLGGLAAAFAGWRLLGR